MQFVDIDTDDVVMRIKAAVMPHKGTFFCETIVKPDMCASFLTMHMPPCTGYTAHACRYGPFWLCTTLVFIMAAAGNFGAYMTHTGPAEEWNYDFKKLTVAAPVLYEALVHCPARHSRSDHNSEYGDGTNC